MLNSHLQENGKSQSVVLSPTTEQSFETLIEKALVGSTIEERKANGTDDVDAQNPETNRFFWGKPKDMDSKLALDRRRLWDFLRASQANALAEYKGRDLEKSVENQLDKVIRNVGIIDVLKKGLDVDNIHLDLFYPRPTAADSESSQKNYEQNQFSVTRQQTFSISNPGLEIDMVVFVNGIPIFTIELKNPWTHQTAKYDGQKQYRSVERNPKETLLQFGRCLAHFTLDKNEAYFTTKLALDKTYFMPFNKGLENGMGAGNPVNPNGGYKTSYFWEKVLSKESISDIIMNYVLFDYGEAKTQKKVPHILKNAKKLIFPRYHQLDVVNKLVADVTECGVGKTYLIQHSAGSGKSNSITWLAFKLIKECPKTMNAVRSKALDRTLYDSVIVVTDRRLLDKQITDNIRAFGSTDKIIAHADTSSDLKTAIEDGKRIIITTIQKFPFICSTIGNVSDHNFAIIIDEAHSSQSGIAADKLNATVQKDEGTSDIGTDEILFKIAKDRKMSSNCSYFAFTATPKRETLERFGWEDEEGKFHAFHLYSMKQAIEEQFILDVLVNYTTYQSYYELIKSVSTDPTFDKDKAQKVLRRAVERDPSTIRTKAEVMLAHFDSNFYRNHKLMGQAKAMVVTKDIECAIRYYKALQEIKQEKKLPFGILIAFSGAKNVDGIEYTEAQMNGFPEKETPENFDSKENKILVVANKYLTGFDQSKLAGMYIDKPLDGVLAVQALSRLNRSAPELKKLSEDIFILDFFNKQEDIKEAFDPFYTSTTLAAPTDINILHELRSTLLDAGVFYDDEIEEFITMYVNGESPDKWSPIIDTAAERFNHTIEWPDNGQADFKMKCKQFVKVYSRVAAILDFEMLSWEKMFWFLRYLIPELHIDKAENGSLRDLLDSVDLNTYGLRRTALNETIVLDAGEATIDPLKPVMVNAGPDEPEIDFLDQIIKEFNERWFKGWNAAPEDQKTKLVSIAKAVANDDDYQNLVVGNPDQQAVEMALASIIDKVIRQKRQGDMSLYKEYQQNDSFKSNFRILINKMLDNLEYMQM